MNRKGGVGMIVLIIFGVLLIVGIGAGIYFYNYHVFKEIRVCVGDAKNLRLPCEVRDDCFNGFNYEDKLDDIPEFLRDDVLEIVDEIVYCNETCFVREVRGVDFESGAIEMLDSCLDGEKEFVTEIRGKEGLEILKWIKSREDV